MNCIPKCRMLAAALCVVILATTSAAEPWEIKLWPGGLPKGSRKLDPARVAKLQKQNSPDRIAYVAEPSLTLYRAAEKTANGCAVVVCPGGGYNILAWEKEGVEVARWLNSLGVTAAVLKYRVPRRDPDAPHQEPLQDVQRAVRVVREHAADWQVDPRRVGVLGFSAGGHLTVLAGTHWDKNTYPAVDDAERLSCRPDFLIPIYAAYLGDADDPTKLDSLVRINKKTPPTFTVVTYDDKQRAIHAALLLVELKQHGVPAELHIYSKGGHGYGLRPSDNPVSGWPKQCADWLRVSGLLQPKE